MSIASPNSCQVNFGGPVDRPFEPFPMAVLHGSVSQRFETIARRFPSRLAIQDRSSSVSYGELLAFVARISAGLSSTLSDHDAPVAILLDNDARYIAAMLGVMASGRTYVPLDASHPQERTHLIADQIGVSAFVSTGAIADRLKGILPRQARFLTSMRCTAHRPCNPIPVVLRQDSLAFTLPRDQRDSQRVCH